MQELKDRETSLSKFLTSDELPTAIGFRMKPFTRKVKEILVDFEETKNSLISTHGILQDKAKQEYKLEGEGLKAFNAALKKVLEEEIELPKIVKLSPEEIAGVKLSANDIEQLDFLFQPTEENNDEDDNDNGS